MGSGGGDTTVNFGEDGRIGGGGCDMGSGGGDTAVVLGAG